MTTETKRWKWCFDPKSECEYRKDGDCKYMEEMWRTDPDARKPLYPDDPDSLHYIDTYREPCVTAYEEEERRKVDRVGE